MKYRPEIDGLRSLAVIPVVLFHAGFDIFSGGFIGVDIFFVISGYLIGKILISEIQNSTFSYTNFYARRARRILPALIVVVLSSILASFVFGLPEHLIEASKSGLFSIIGVSNIFFWTQSGYFSPSSEFSILLHTWSLGVEEQFYLLLPPTLLLAFKLKFRLNRILYLIVPLLFFIGLWLSFHKPSVAFYLLPARAWELAIGVALAAGIFPHSTNIRLHNYISLTGLILLVSSIFVIDKQMPFPGWAALLPCIGTAAIIYSASRSNITGYLLALAPLRFIGLISYSWYLWHWPVFVTLRLYNAEPHLDLTTALLGILLSLSLAIITWKFIETPCRSKERKLYDIVLTGIAATSVILILLSTTAIVKDGFPTRLSGQSQRFLSAAEDIDPLRMRCQGMHEISDPMCRFGQPKVPIDFILLGDSHAGAIRPAIEEWALGSGRAGSILWSGACPMLAGAVKVPDIKAEKCSEFKENILQAIAQHQDIRTVFIAGRWEAAYSGIAPEIGGSYKTFLIDETNTQLNAAVTKIVFEDALVRTGQDFEQLGIQTVFIGAVPEVGFDVPRVLALASKNQGGAPPNRIKREMATTLEVDQVFQRIVMRLSNSVYISIWRNFCDDKCSLLHNGIPLYSDDDHLTNTAAKDFMGPILQLEINRALKKIDNL